jgi:DNA-binding XRE family transcriptional regulator
MVQKMKEVDPTGKGVSTMTVINAEKSLDSMKLKTLLMMCNALDISPRTIFTNKNGE